MDLVIPEFANDEWGNSYEVVAICDYAFYFTEIESVLIPETVTGIGESAFSGCTSLTSLTIPESVESIGAMAFSDCIGITGTLIIPESVTQIGDNAFYNCTGITGIEFGNSVSQIEAGAFSGCIGLEGEIIFPNSLNFIGASAFSNCSGLSSIVIPNSVTSIGSEAFSYCTGVETVYFDANIVYEEVPDVGLVVPYETFSNCSGVLTVGSSVRIIPKNFFQNCGFSGITIENGLTQIEKYAFYNSYNLSGSLVFPNSLTTIQESAFENCSAFNGQLVLPNSITTVGKCAFKNCTGFTEIEYNISSGSNYNYSGENPFYHCGGALIVGNGVVRVPNYMFCDSYISSAVINAINIGDHAFADCFSMDELTLGESVRTIGKGAFNFCTGLSTIHYLCNNCSCDSGESPFYYYCKGSIDIGNNVESIPNYMFYNNPTTGIGFQGNLVIPESVHSIGNYAFANNSFTGSLAIPNAVTTIGNRAFLNCSGFESLTLGESVTAIGSSAFIGCNSLTIIVVLTEVPPMLEANSFGETTLSNAIVIVPCGSLEEYQSNNEWNNFAHIQDNCSPAPIHSQDIQLSQGWNWWAPNVALSLPQLESILENKGLSINSQNAGTATFINGTWSGTLDTIVAGHMYRIEISAPCDATLSGLMVTSVTINIQPGPNWFGFIGTEEKSISEAISIEGTLNDKIVSQSGGFAIYDGTTWQGTLTTLQPGHGYVYDSNSSDIKTLTIGTRK